MDKENEGFRGYFLHTDMSSGSSLTDVAVFLVELEKARIHYTLTTAREGAVMVQVAIPNERWEIEFFPNRSPEVEIFRGDENMYGPEALDRLFRENTN